ncbi:MAG: hypothetical protein HFF18_01090 [Oscillospiraceae bacterium]|nr:hypothetical protein [Oscillospiraceae bacterium]
MEQKELLDWQHMKSQLSLLVFLLTKITIRTGVALSIWKTHLGGRFDLCSYGHGAPRLFLSSRTGRPYHVKERAARFGEYIAKIHISTEQTLCYDISQEHR